MEGFYLVKILDGKLFNQGQKNWPQFLILVGWFTSFWRKIHVGGPFLDDAAYWGHLFEKRNYF